MATNANAPTKSFIIKHMNTSHADSLSLYLRAYCGVSAHFAHPAILQDISHSDLLITAKGTRYSVPINPPMTSLAETRARVVAMHKDSLQRLGLSDITIAEYRPPAGAPGRLASPGGRYAGGVWSAEQFPAGECVLRDGGLRPVSGVYAVLLRCCTGGGWLIARLAFGGGDAVGG